MSDKTKEELYAQSNYFFSIAGDEIRSIMEYLNKCRGNIGYHDERFEDVTEAIADDIKHVLKSIKSAAEILGINTSVEE